MKKTAVSKLLDSLNTDYSKIHKRYENLFWRFYMGEKSLEKKFNQVTKDFDAFKADKKMAEKVNDAYEQASGESKKRLGWWKKFFELYRLNQLFLMDLFLIYDVGT